MKNILNLQKMPAKELNAFAAGSTGSSHHQCCNGSEDKKDL